MFELIYRLRVIGLLATHMVRGALGWGVVWIIAALALLVGTQTLGVGGEIRTALAEGNSEAIRRIALAPVRSVCEFGAVIGWITALALGSRALSGEARQRTLLLVLSRPVSRTQLLWGTALGAGVVCAIVILTVTALGAAVLWSSGINPGIMFVFGALYFMGVGMVWAAVPTALSAHVGPLGSLVGGIIYFFASRALFDQVTSTAIRQLLALMMPAELPADIRRTFFAPPMSLVEPDYWLIVSVVGENVLVALLFLTFSGMLAERRDLRVRF